MGSSSGVFEILLEISLGFAFFILFLIFPMSYFQACFEGKLLFSKLQISQCVAENVRKRDAVLEASTHLSVAGLIKNGSSNQKNK